MVSQRGLGRRLLRKGSGRVLRLAGSAEVVAALLVQHGGALVVAIGELFDESDGPVFFKVDLVFVLAAVQVGEVGEQAVVGRAAHLDGVRPSLVVQELQLGGEAERPLPDEGEVHPDFALGDSQVLPIRVVDLQVQFVRLQRRIVRNIVHQIQVFIPVVDDPESALAAHSQRNDRHYHVVPIEEQFGEDSLPRHLQLELRLLRRTFRVDRDFGFGFLRPDGVKPDFQGHGLEGQKAPAIRLDDEDFRVLLRERILRDVPFYFLVRLVVQRQRLIRRNRLVSAKDDFLRKLHRRRRDCQLRRQSFHRNHAR